MSFLELHIGTIVYEDDHVLAVNKPPGIAVMGAKDSIIDRSANAGLRLLPVHRIDKVASGLVLFARDQATHGDLTRQFNKQTVEKTYLAVVHGTDMPDSGTIDLPLSTGRKNRVRIAGPREAIRYDHETARWSLPADAVDASRPSYPSLTRFTRCERRDRTTVLEVQPVSGRRHQIRVHLAWIGYPIVGDPIFAKGADSRTMLHSWRLDIDYGGRRVRFEAAADPGMFGEAVAGQPFGELRSSSA